MRTEKNEWRHLGENAIAANPHPTLGGIIDKNTYYDNWFIVFNHEHLPIIENLSSKAEAFEVFEKTLKENGITE